MTKTEYIENNWNRDAEGELVMHFSWHEETLILRAHRAERDRGGWTVFDNNGKVLRLGKSKLEEVKHTPKVQA